MANQFHALGKNARISPTKVRPSANLIKGKRVEDAINQLRFQPRRGSVMLRKVLESAISNASTVGGMDPMDLIVTDARIDQGFTISRWRPASRGRTSRRDKQCCHIYVSVGKA